MSIPAFSENIPDNDPVNQSYSEWAQPTHGVCRIMIIAFALVVAFPYILGSNSLAFKEISI